MKEKSTSAKSKSNTPTRQSDMKETRQSLQGKESSKNAGSQHMKADKSEDKGRSKTHAKS